MSKTIVLSPKTTVEIEERFGDELLAVYDFIGMSMNSGKYMQACAFASVVKINEEVVAPMSSQKAFDYVAHQFDFFESFKLLAAVNSDEPTGEDIKN